MLLVRRVVGAGVVLCHPGRATPGYGIWPSSSVDPQRKRLVDRMSELSDYVETSLNLALRSMPDGAFREGFEYAALCAINAAKAVTEPLPDAEDRSPLDATGGTVSPERLVGDVGQHPAGPIPNVRKRIPSPRLLGPATADTRSAPTGYETAGSERAEGSA